MTDDRAEETGSTSAIDFLGETHETRSTDD